MRFSFLDSLQSKNNTVYPNLFYQFNFDSGAVRLSTGFRNEFFNLTSLTQKNAFNSISGALFYGVGDAFNNQNKNRTMIGDISELIEPNGGEVAGQTIKLSGIPTSAVSLALNQAYTNRTCNIYMGFTSDNGVTSKIEMVSILLIENIAIEISKVTANIEVSLKSRMYNWNKPIVRKSTNADQQALYPNDLSHSLVNFTVNNKPIWG